MFAAGIILLELLLGSGLETNLTVTFREELMTLYVMHKLTCRSLAAIPSTPE